MNTLLVNGLPSSSMCCRAERKESRRVEGGRTSSTSQEQWSVFSWITVASSSLLSHWFTLLHHSPTQEAVTNRNDKSSKLAANIPRWLIFKVTFVSEINVLTCWHKKHIIWGCKKKKITEEWVEICLCDHDSVTQMERFDQQWTTMTHYLSHSIKG